MMGSFGASGAVWPLVPEPGLSLDCETLCRVQRSSDALGWTGEDPDVLAGDSVDHVTGPVSTAPWSQSPRCLPGAHAPFPFHSGPLFPLGLVPAIKAHVWCRAESKSFYDRSSINVHDDIEDYPLRSELSPEIKDRCYSNIQEGASKQNEML